MSGVISSEADCLYSVQHRAVQGAVKGNYRRDMRRTTVHDASPDAFGLNGDGATWRVGLP